MAGVRQHCCYDYSTEKNTRRDSSAQRPLPNMRLWGGCSCPAASNRTRRTRDHNRRAGQGSAVARGLLLFTRNSDAASGGLHKSSGGMMMIAVRE